MELPDRRVADQKVGSNQPSADRPATAGSVRPRYYIYDVVEDPRTLQANERTLLAWLRTGVSLITFGFFIARLGLWLRIQTGIQSAPRSALVGGALVLLGGITEVVGIVRYLRVRRALLAQRPVPVGAVDVIAIAVVVALLAFYLASHLMLFSKSV